MRQETINIYKFSELPETTQQKIIDNNHSINIDYQWWNFTFEDFITICKIIGIDINYKNIFFSGFSCQGDGASYTGSFSYKKGMVKKIKQHVPKDKELHNIAENIAAIQKKYFYLLSGNIAVHPSYYSHENTMYCNIDERWTNCCNLPYKIDFLEDQLIECFQDLARWLYSRLNSEYEHLTGSEQIKETLIINEYEFLENGDFA